MALIVDLARGVVALTGLYFTALGVTVLTRPDRATRFLLGFAGSPAAHYTELSVRLVEAGQVQGRGAGGGLVAGQRHG